MTARTRLFTRRQFLLRALAAGLTALGGVLLGKWGWREWKVGRVHPPRRRRPGKVLTEHEYATLVALAEIIVPGDDLGPGATDVRAADTIEQWLMRDARMLARYRAGLRWLDEASAQAYGPGTYFRYLTPDQQRALLEDAERALQDLRKPVTHVWDRVWRYWDKLVVTYFGLGAGVPFVHLVRDDVLEAVYTHPQTWIALGYDGPPQPLGYWNGARGNWNIIDDCPPKKRRDFAHWPEGSGE